MNEILGGGRVEDMLGNQPNAFGAFNIPRQFRQDLQQPIRPPTQVPLVPQQAPRDPPPIRTKKKRRTRKKSKTTNR